MTNALAAATAVAIQFVADTNSPSRIRLDAHPAPPAAVLSLHRVDPASGKTGPAMFGRTYRRGDRLSFLPSVSLKNGEEYQGRLNGPKGDIATQRYRVPSHTGLAASPEVLVVYPTARKVPANLLKFYVYFSEPMREGREIFDLIRIVDLKGREVQTPWRQVELWDAEAKRLTLWFHPGRIKRGVSLRETTGAILQSGEEYQLVIDGRVRAMSGAALGKTFRHRFSAVEEDHLMPLPKDWRMEIPTVGTKDVLKVRAAESFDHVLWKRHQWIEDVQGRRVNGRVELVEGERVWLFTPERKWQKGPHNLCVDQWLEDLGGNGPGRPFERDVNEAETAVGVTRRSFMVH